MHNDLNSSSSFPQMHTNTYSQKNQHGNILAKKKKSFPQMHTNTSSQKNQHRDILAKKKKKNPNGKTNKPKRKNKKETNRCLSERSELVGLAWSELVGMGLDRSSELWIGAAVDRCCCGSMLVIRAVDR